MHTLIFTREWRILNLSVQEMLKYPTELGCGTRKSHSLSDQVKQPSVAWMPEKTECEERVQEIEQSKNELESLLAEAQAKIAELQTAPSAFTNDDADYLAQFDDTNTSILPSGSADEIISLWWCYNGLRWSETTCPLCRDLNHNGQYSIFRKDDNISDDFTNWYRFPIEMVLPMMAFTALGYGIQFRMIKILPKIIYYPGTTRR